MSVSAFRFYGKGLAAMAALASTMKSEWYDEPPLATELPVEDIAPTVVQSPDNRQARRAAERTAAKLLARSKRRVKR